MLMNKSSLSVIILTLNEQKHIERCIKSLTPFASDIYIVDAGSTDNTTELARAAGAKVYENPWVNYATQFNWALENIPIQTEWVMRMDADEFVTDKLADNIKKKLPELDKKITGIYVNRRVYFMGRWIRHGGYYPTKLLRIWRNQKGRCEERWMDEHIYLFEGQSIQIKGDIVDDNLNNITWWTAKHNNYATREAIDLLNIKYRFIPARGLVAETVGHQDSRKRWLKEAVYSRLSPGCRALIYFLFRYFVRLGFLDGFKGTIFHILQGFWYRFLVDVKIYEIENKIRREGLDAKTVIEKEYGYKFE